jgi:hypothetical protein
MADKKMVVNLSDVQLEHAAYSALVKSLNYAVATAVLPIKDISSSVEKAASSLLEEVAEEI